MSFIIFYSLRKGNSFADFFANIGRISMFFTLFNSLHVALEMTMYRNRVGLPFFFIDLDTF